MSRRRPPVLARAAAAAAAAALLAGCAPLSDRVILLPGRDGAGTGAVTVEAARGTVVLAEPYAQADVAGGRVTRAQSSPEAVARDYGGLLAMQPPAPRRFVLGFESGTDRLVPEAEAVLVELRAALAGNPGADLVVTGHTDRVGGVEANDRLSLARAQAVRDRLVALGAAPARIAVVGRGEREPAVATADEVAEPRNRRVEIRLR